MIEIPVYAVIAAVAFLLWLRSLKRRLHSRLHDPQPPEVLAALRLVRGLTPAFALIWAWPSLCPTAAIGLLTPIGCLILTIAWTRWLEGTPTPAVVLWLLRAFRASLYTYMGANLLLYAMVFSDEIGLFEDILELLFGRMTDMRDPRPTPWAP